MYFSSPLKTLTIPDRSPPVSPRTKFLKKFRAGAANEGRVRREIARQEFVRRSQEEQNDDNDNNNNSNRNRNEKDDDDDEEEDYEADDAWAEMSEAKDELYRSEKQNKISQAFTEGFVRAETEEEESTTTTTTLVSSPKDDNEYQFVGVLGNKHPNSTTSNTKKEVKWYARPKPKSAKWSIRLVRVDRAAVLRDQFVKGKIDIYGEYVNRGLAASSVPPEPKKNNQQSSSLSASNKDKTTTTTVTRLRMVPHIEPVYTVKKRSWKTLWNVSPSAFFKDRSGMYWRERRINSGLYTDGQDVFRSTYHYGRGRNGMKRMSDLDLDTYCRETNTPKQSLEHKLKHDSPDLVMEY